MEPVNNSAPVRVLRRLTIIWPATAWVDDNGTKGSGFRQRMIMGNFG